MAEEEKAQTEKPEAKEAAPAVKPAPAKKAASGGKVAVIRIRNITQADGAIRDTIKMLRLHKKFTCAVYDKTPSMMGMLSKAKDYVTFGEVDEATVKMLQDKRGTKDKEGKMNNFFHLHPPTGGFERKGIKRNFVQGGALGYRADKIKALIEKMM